MRIFRLYGYLSLVIYSLPSYAETVKGIRFSHHDWEIACDNTRNCRAVGYQSENVEDLPLALLLERAAGANQAVTAQLMLGDRSEDNIAPPTTLVMKINGKSLGKISINQQERIAKLSSTQTASLLAALRRDCLIEWFSGKDTWVLSDKGASAVLLKMDEFQGRLGTKGALVKKGNLDESKVLPPLPKPIVISPKLPKTLDADKTFLKKNEDAIKQALKTTTDEENNYCPKLDDPEFGKSELSIVRLTSNRFLISADCWMAAYNWGVGYWIINDKLPYNPKLITTSASGDSDGGIYSTQKGRGIGDCLYTEDWVWNGKDFIQSSIFDFGMCKLVAAGGAWPLPTLVTEIR